MTATIPVSSRQSIYTGAGLAVGPDNKHVYIRETGTGSGAADTACNQHSHKDSHGHHHYWRAHGLRQYERQFDPQPQRGLRLHPRLEY